MSEKVQSDITKGKISSSLGISVQVFDTLKKETIVYECKKLAAKYLVKLIQLLGVTLKIENYCFLDTLFFNCISIVLCLI